MTAAFTDEHLPGIWRDADRASGNGQTWSIRYSILRLSGSILAAVGGVFSLHAGRLDLAAIAIFVGFGVALASEIATWTHQPERLWYDGRAVAESAKTLAWRYAVGAEPFPTATSKQEAENELRERMRSVVGEVSDRITIRSTDPVVTSQMNALRQRPFEERRTAYIRDRTRKQQKWYADKARTNRRRSTGWRITLIIAEVTALLLAALRLTGGWDIDLAGLMAALIAAGAAWVAVKQFSPLASAYSVAANELGIQADKLRSVPENDWSVVAADAEEAISREHTLWLASRTGKTPPP